jgi:DNA-binding MarR family transcriptional regulator
MPRTSNHDVSEKLDRDDSIKAQRLLHAINEFRDIESAFPASYMAAFLLVALKPGGGPTDYAKHLGTVPPVASRMLLEVGEKQRNGKPGCGLIERHQDINDFRATHYTLTPKGKKFLRRLLDNFGV